MLHRFLLTLLALLLAAVVAVAEDTGGGEGGAINLPGGRMGHGMQSVRAPMTWTVSGTTDLRMRVTPELAKALVVLRGQQLPFVLQLTPDDAIITIALDTQLALRAGGDTGFTLDIVAVSGEHLHVVVDFGADGTLQVTAL